MFVKSRAELISAYRFAAEPVFGHSFGARHFKTNTVLALGKVHIRRDFRACENKRVV